MIDLHYWFTPNGDKPLIFVHEAGLEHRVKTVDIGKDEQFAPAFLAIAPNNRIPAIVDHAPADGGAPVSVFESGAILLYLAEKTGRFVPADARLRIQAVEWLMWQMGGFGPMLGQAHHFRVFAPEQVPYGIERYTKEAQRLYGVLERRLAGRDWLADEYSVADMAAWPWSRSFEMQGVEIEKFPAVAAWQKRMEERPAVAAALAAKERLQQQRQA
ncbi:MAG: glutathione S-transferase N-terminal domain-containing protein [Betaproteobacteria bacterium AqS2]|uniref:Glutathione S-transferase N-terminal domain-containing protein n=1 Tax=Candidatus Amphirhobacter heronislandensis TaxID=1732024 RepID=A0A930UFG9_9GAMM|nr:glutathione S-transferase N-terminal domain-containing protein [Betaproteobacteria bacterium AqS2]